MFYSHQLLARKAPLGQIWMAATMHAKMNRKKLNKINLIRICDEILNPSVPMALRLSGILLGGVVIVYERKVKLLYDDVNRLMVEINEAWKAKAAPDPTVLPKGKSQAKKEAVTLPENPETDLGDVEQSLNFSNATATMGFQKPAYFAMRLDNVEEPYINNDLGEEDGFHHFHQADAENITLFEQFHVYQDDTNTYNHFERFDIEGDDETQVNFTSREHVDVPSTHIHSPPPENEAQRDKPEVDEMPAYPEDKANQQSNGNKEARQDQHNQRPVRRRTHRQATSAMDYEQTIILGHIYQSWLQNSSDIISNRRSKKKVRRDFMSTMKVANLMELPPLVLIDNSWANGNREIYYPKPLFELWMRNTQSPHESPSARTNMPLPPEPSSSSPPHREEYQGSFGYNAFDDIHSGVGSQSFSISIEKQLPNLVNDDMTNEIIMAHVGANFMNNGVKITESNLVTPGNSGSGHGDVPMINISNKKRPHSSSRNSSNGLDPVAEENDWQIPDANFKLSRLSENGPTPELLEETAPTQMQRPVISQPADHITDSIRIQMKVHFETPGAPKTESLCRLTAGMNRKGAALLFYQTCVLASRGILRVEQQVAYGDIYVSKGAKM